MGLRHAVAATAFVLAIAAALPAQLVITEFVARNNTGIQDQNMQFEDWIEITNLGAGPPLDISGYYMTDDLLVPTKWAFPPNTTIAPGQTLLIWADEDLLEGPLHADFKLSANGEEIGLFAPNGTTLIDSVKFGPQLPDVAEGRLAGSTANRWYAFPTPTPRAPNQPTPCGNLPIDRIAGLPNPGGVLAGGAGPQVGKLATWTIGGAPTSAAGKMALSTGAGYFDLGATGALLLDVTNLVLFDTSTDATGAGNFALPVPNVAQLAGVTFYLQAWLGNTTANGLTSGVIARVCP